ncbi:uncharacterized protein Triagg1_530 [Trichoderma aggressivum f. europaeum]|uniref:Uncharacterized protein n=1 Tax=Trichoderma aggressivum f. europaeum TaxID=173218 RepID=A0AAE1M3X4_9HYPO|nr:hypothetical protein Triagg1_530 [Trichoderma aggressivum f. europaeum]
MELMQWFKPFLVLCLLPLVQAYTVFETNCSVPVTRSNYVSSPNTRGTLDILWTSLFTIFACTWTLQHPNVPKQRDVQQEEQELEHEDDFQQEEQEGEHEDQPKLQKYVLLMRVKWVKLEERYAKWMDATWKDVKWRNARWGDAQWALTNFYASTLRMLLTVIAPELIMFAAADNWVAARENCREMRRYAKQDRVAWSLSHSYFANMGGFVIRAKPTDEQRHHDPYHLTGNSILALRERGFIEKLHSMTKAEINDRSKGDILVKLIALGQIIWSVIEIIARAFRRLPVSPLEVAVVAFAVSAIFIYGLYWNKPQRVGVAQAIQLGNSDMLSEETESERVGLDAGAISEERAMPDKVYALLKSIRSRRILKGAPGNAFGVQMETLPGAPISLDSQEESQNAGLIIGVVGVGAAMFGGIHVIAWNFAFPSTAELILWRYASVYTTVAPLCTLLFDFSYHRRLEDKIEDVFGEVVGDIIGKLLHGVLAALPIFLYVIARIFIVVEMFRTLCFLPPGSYISTWTSNIPHVG